jgi:excisionase family DNA binding protein
MGLAGMVAVLWNSDIGEWKMKSFYSIKEAADYLDVDYKVVYRLVKEGAIPSTRIGWQYRIDPDDLAGYLSAQRVKQTAAGRSERGNGAGERTGAQRDADVIQNAPPQRVAPDRPPLPPETTLSGITKLQARQMEERFIRQFNVRVASIENIWHPLTDQILDNLNWPDIHVQTEDRAGLMKALKTAFLDQQTLARTPRGVTSRYVIPAEPPLVLEVKTVLHLERYVRRGADDMAAGLDDLKATIADVDQDGAGACCIVGLASPTGWAKAAIEWARKRGDGDDPCKFFLIDLRDGRVYYHEQDAVSASFAGLFTEEDEDQELIAVRHLLQSEADAQMGLIIQDFVDKHQLDPALVIDAARHLEAQRERRLILDKKEGWILV